MLKRRIIDEALEWVGTPYARAHHPVKGHGCDCASLLPGVAMSIGIIPPDYPIPAYSVDRHHHKSDQSYRRHLLDAGFTEIPVNLANPGDVILFVMGRGQPASHAGILISGMRMVHAYGTLGKVVVTRLDEKWIKRARFAFEFPGV